MKVVGRVDSLWRYPVKSMRGEELTEAFASFGGVYGDRFYAFVSSGLRKGFPYLTATTAQAILTYRPAYRYPEQMIRPPNLAEAEAIAPGVTPVYPDGHDLAVDVETPGGDVLAVDDPRLASMLQEDLRDGHEVRLLQSQRSMIDCRPVSLISHETLGQLSQALGADLDKRRFRANMYVKLESEKAFGEDEFIGRMLRIGRKAVIAVLEHDPRCKMITLDPESGEANPEIMRQVARDHDGNAGVYAAVVVEGTIRPGDEIVALQ